MPNSTPPSEHASAPPSELWKINKPNLCTLCSCKNYATRQEYDSRGRGWSDRRLENDSRISPWTL